MANQQNPHRLPSDPERLLELLDGLSDESDSGDEFDGYLDASDVPVALRGSEQWVLESTPSRSRSADSLVDAVSESEMHISPFSPSPLSSPMQLSSVQLQDAASQPLPPTTLTVSIKNNCCQKNN